MDPLRRQEILTSVAKIDGWLSVNEGEILFDMAAQCQGRGALVEIGSWKGKSTIWLAQGSAAGCGKPIIAIDPHIGSAESKQRNMDINTFTEFKNNIRAAGVEHLVKPIVELSENAVVQIKDPVEFIFIDGGHDYDSVKKDFDLWFPKVLNGGWLAFHDTVGHKGPREVVNRFVYQSPYFKNIRLVDEIVVAEKVERISTIERIQNLYGLCVKKLCEAAVDIKIPKPLRNFGKRIIKIIQ